MISACRLSKRCGSCAWLPCWVCIESMHGPALHARQRTNMIPCQKKNTKYIIFTDEIFLIYNEEILVALSKRHRNCASFLSAKAGRARAGRHRPALPHSPVLVPAAKPSRPPEAVPRAQRAAVVGQERAPRLELDGARRRLGPSSILTCVHCEMTG